MLQLLTAKLRIIFESTKQIPTKYVFMNTFLLIMATRALHTIRDRGTESFYVFNSGQ